MKAYKPGVGVQLMRLAARLNADVAKALTPIDLTSPQLKILSVVAFHPEKRCTVNDIKAQMLDPMSNVSRMLNKLLDKNLIVKKASTEDARSVFIYITEAGFELMREGKERMDSQLTAFNNLTQAEQSTLEAILVKLQK